MSFQYLSAALLAFLEGWPLGWRNLLDVTINRALHSHAVRAARWV
ncbi:MAG: hypothetical protein ABSG10_04960 [Terracidiphilus sp.]|jgi:hypothetical protein